jgi:hypothetical protein
MLFRIPFVARIACLWAGLVLLLAPWATAQIGGAYVFEHLRIPASPRLTALGGTHISQVDTDPAQGFANPALLNAQMHNRLYCSAVSYLAGIGYGTASYVRHWDSVGTFFGGVQYFSYGQLTRADAFGQLQGEFSAGDVSLNLGAARSFGRFSTGMSVKVLNSYLDGLSAWGMALDIGGAYYHAEQDFGIGLMLRNLGTQFSTFTPGDDRAPLPFEIVAGISKRVPHTPLRFSLTLTNLNRPTMAYTDPTAPQQLDLNGVPIDDAPSTADQIFRHVIFATEFLLGKNVQVRTAYNHQRRAEFRLQDAEGLSLDGFSFGFGFRVKMLHFDYGMARFFRSGSVHHFGVGLNLAQLKHTPSVGLQ